MGTFAAFTPFFISERLKTTIKNKDIYMSLLFILYPVLLYSLKQRSPQIDLSNYAKQPSMLLKIVYMEIQILKTKFPKFWGFLSIP